jgi:hypothetical protein
MCMRMYIKTRKLDYIGLATYFCQLNLKRNLNLEILMVYTVGFISTVYSKDQCEGCWLLLVSLVDGVLRLTYTAPSPPPRLEQLLLMCCFRARKNTSLRI